MASASGYCAVQCLYMLHALRWKLLLQVVPSTTVLAVGKHIQAAVQHKELSADRLVSGLGLAIAGATVSSASGSTTLSVLTAVSLNCFSKHVIQRLHGNAAATEGTGTKATAGQSLQAAQQPDTAPLLLLDAFFALHWLSNVAPGFIPAHVKLADALQRAGQPQAGHTVLRKLLYQASGGKSFAPELLQPDGCAALGTVQAAGQLVPANELLWGLPPQQLDSQLVYMHPGPVKHATNVRKVLLQYLGLSRDVGAVHALADIVEWGLASSWGKKCNNALVVNLDEFAPAALGCAVSDTLDAVAEALAAWPTEAEQLLVQLQQCTQHLLFVNSPRPLLGSNAAAPAQGAEVPKSSAMRQAVGTSEAAHAHAQDTLTYSALGDGGHEDIKKRLAELHKALKAGWRLWMLLTFAGPAGDGMWLQVPRAQAAAAAAIQAAPGGLGELFTEWAEQHANSGTFEVLAMVRYRLKTVIAFRHWRAKHSASACQN